MQTVFSLGEDFIGTVKGYDRTKRTVQVFIPKLMPGIAEGRGDITTRTNLGNSSIQVKYNENITIASDIQAYAYDANNGMPTIGSHVLTFFLDDQTDEVFWLPFNKNSDYEVIDEEKYSKLYTLKIGSKEFEVYDEDTVTITLPDDFSVLYTESTDGKTKNITIKSADSLSEKVTSLETIIGSKTVTRTYEDAGVVKVTKTLASGLSGDIEALEEKIQELEEKIANLSS